MSGPQHHYNIPNLNPNQQSAARNQFSPTIQNQMPVQMAPQINNTVLNQMSNNMNNLNGNPVMSGGGPQMSNQMNQAYNVNANQTGQHATVPGNSLQMPDNSIGTIQHHGVQQINHQESGNVVTSASAVVQQQPQPPQQQQQQQQQSKEFNTASLCRIGQETVQDIVSRTQEVFQTLKTIQPPGGTHQLSSASNEKKAKVQEQLRTIRVLFKRLRLIYEKCNENCQLQGMEYTHIESLIPFRDQMDPKHDEKKNSEAYRLTCEESKEVMDQVILKNKQLKEVIDHLRRLIWEINTMLTMRRS